MPASRIPEPPARPTLPFTFWALAAVIATEQGVLRAAPGPGRRCIFFVAGAAAVIFLAALWFYMHERPRQARFSLVIAAAIMISGCIAGMGVAASTAGAEALSSSPVSAWRFSVISDATFSNGRYRSRARASCDGAARVDVWLYTAEPLCPGMEVQGIGSVQPLGDSAWARISRSQGVYLSVSMLRIERVSSRMGLCGGIEDVRQHLIEIIDPDASPARALMAACALGEKRGLVSQNLNDMLRRCGISHLVAVSGTHLAIVAASCTAVLDTTAVRARRRAVMLVIAAGIFVVLCGAPASAVRAWIMVLLHATSLFAERREHGLSALCAAAIAMALLDPFVTGQLSYQLSVAAVLGIYIINPYMRYVLEVMLSHRGCGRSLPHRLSKRLYALERSLRDLVALSLTAQIATLPITAASFDELSLIAPLSNIVASLPMSVLTVLGLLACLMGGVPPMCSLVMLCADPLGDVLVMCLSVLSSARWSTVSVPTYGSALGILLLVAMLVLAWRSPVITRRSALKVLAVIAIPLICWYLRCRYLAPARLVVLDVGQGDAILIQEGPHAVLVDAGPADMLDDALLRNGVFHIDALFISHFHNDHYGGIADLAATIGCDQIVVAQGSMGYAPTEISAPAGSMGAWPPREIHVSDTVGFGGFTLTMLGPEGEVDGLENEDSLFMLVEYDDGRRHMSALLTGDGESAELAAVMDRWNLSDIDILKVGHHGSEGSITEQQAMALSVAYAAASAGENNEFGHPHAACVDVLERSGATFLCTKEIGDVVFVPTAEGARALSYNR